MKKHRIVSCVLTAAIIFMILGNITASASTMRASPTLSSYGVVLTKGSSGGKVIITYDVLANSVAESLGVSSIVIYKSSGDYVTTIYPTTLNGLKTSNAMWHRSSYTYSGTSGGQRTSCINRLRY